MSDLYLVAMFERIKRNLFFPLVGEISDPLITTHYLPETHQRIFDLVFMDRCEQKHIQASVGLDEILNDTMSATNKIINELNRKLESIVGFDVEDYEQSFTPQKGAWGL